MVGMSVDILRCESEVDVCVCVRVRGRRGTQLAASVRPYLAMRVHRDPRAMRSALHLHHSLVAC